MEGPRSRELLLKIRVPGVRYGVLAHVVNKLFPQFLKALREAHDLEFDGTVRKPDSDDPVAWKCQVMIAKQLFRNAVRKRWVKEEDEPDSADSLEELKAALDWYNERIRKVVELMALGKLVVQLRDLELPELHKVLCPARMTLLLFLSLPAPQKP